MNELPAIPDEVDDEATRAEVERGFNWLRDLAWPLWLEHGVDWRRGAFHEHLDLETLGCSADFRRLRVAARQTFVFAQAARFARADAPGLARAEEAVALGVAFLRGPARLPDGGYAWRFDLDNRPVDLTRDLYDHAFVLLALASAAPVLGPESLRADALALVEYLDARFAHPRGGYHEATPHAVPRRQNPHMHLLEALLAAHDAFGDRVFLDRADAIVALFAEKLFRTDAGALAEFFDDTLEPLREEERFIAEPGHHAEWIWLCDRYRGTVMRAGRAPASDRLEAIGLVLQAFNDRFGSVPGRAGLLDKVWSDGTPADTAARLWPQLERLKADIRRPYGAARATVAGFKTAFGYLDGVRAGLWRERRSSDGDFVPEPAPATSLYHLTSAFLDAWRRAGPRD